MAQMVILDTDLLTLLMRRNNPQGDWLCHKATLRSRNLKDFQQIPGVDVQDWSV